MTTLKRLSWAIIVLACLEFVVTTLAVQIRQLPSRTDFASYYLAGEMTRRNENPYDRARLASYGQAIGFEHEQYPFLYPPPFALAMQPLAQYDYSRARQVWMGLTTVMLFAALALMARLLQLQSRLLALESSGYGWVLLSAFVVASLNSTGVHNDLRSGSVGILLFFFFTLLSLALLQGWHTRSATAIILATFAKLSPIVLLPYVWWRGSRVAFGRSLLGLILCSALAVLHWGWEIHLHYWRDGILPVLRSEISWSHNLSLDGYLSRLFISNSMVEAPFDMPWLKHVLAWGLGGMLLLLTLLAVMRRQRCRPLIPVELSLVVLALLILMKITWVHTLTAMLFAWPLLMQVIMRAAERGLPWAGRLGVVACTGFFPSSAHLPVLWNERLRGGFWVLLTGLHLLGLLLLWGSARYALLHQDEIFEEEDWRPELLAVDPEPSTAQVVAQREADQKQ